MARPRARLEEVGQNGGVEEWRIIKDHPDYEITRDGVIRKYVNKKVIVSTGFGPVDFWYKSGRYRKSVRTEVLRNIAWPELEAW